MTDQMTMNAIIHAAVRRDLRRFEAALANFPVGSQARARQLHAAWQNFDGQLTHHHEGEETIFWPAMRELGVTDSLLKEMDDEHELMAEALASARAAVAALVAAPDDAHLAPARAALSLLRERVEKHFDHEEQELEPVFAGSLQTPPMKRAVAAIRKSLNLPDTGVHFAWLQDDAAPDASAALRNTIPPPVLFMLSKVAGRRYWKQVAPAWN